MITDTITKLIGEAMKARDEIRLSTLRMLSSALNYEKIAKQHDLNEEEELAVVRRELKKRKDAIEAYEKVGATDRAEKEKKEGEILEAYLPAQMADSELEKIVQDAIAETGVQSLSEIGKIMGAVMPKVMGKADGGRVSGMVKKLLS